MKTSNSYLINLEKAEKYKAKLSRDKRMKIN
jgi:hypothetical protein